MSNFTIEEELNQNLGIESDEITTNDYKEIEETPSRNKGIMEMLKTETGAGSIDSYKDHALNFNKSEGMAQVIRGLTGFFDNLNLAIIDIGVGLFRMMNKKKVGAAA